MVHVANDDNKEGKNTARIVIDATAGAIAGCIARIIIGPLDVIKIRFQVQLEPIMVSGINNIISGSNSSIGGGSSGPGSVARQSKYTGFGQAFKTIVREEGIQVRANYSKPNMENVVAGTRQTMPRDVRKRRSWRGYILTERKLFGEPDAVLASESPRVERSEEKSKLTLIFWGAC